MKEQEMGRRQSGAAALLMLVLAACGCGEEKATVSGTVRYRGKPLKSGTVTFTGTGNRTFAAKIDEQGRYTVSGLAAGSATATVTSPRPVPAPRIKLPQPVEGAEGPSPAAQRGWFAIPPQYGEPNRSGLRYTLTGGDNNVDIDLK